LEATTGITQSGTMRTSPKVTSACPAEALAKAGACPESTGKYGTKEIVPGAPEIKKIVPGAPEIKTPLDGAFLFQYRVYSVWFIGNKQ
jgi:hypothetical protein